MALENKTRDELVDMAVASGIDGAHYLTRDELLRVLGSSDPVTALRGARRWLKGIVASLLGASELSDKSRSSAPLGGVAEEPLQADAPDAETPAKEPIRTRTMARLLVEQGHAERAATILRDLEASVAESAPQAVIATPPPSAKRGERSMTTRAADTVNVNADAPSTLAVSWSVSERGEARARRIAGDGAARTLRVVAIETMPGGGVRSRLLTFGDLAETGTRRIEDLEPGATCLAAVGLAAGDRFVAVAHAPRFVMPAAEHTTSPMAIVMEAAASTPSDKSAPQAPPAPVAHAPQQRGTVTRSGEVLAPRPARAARQEASRATYAAAPAKAGPAPLSGTHATDERSVAVWEIALRSPIEGKGGPHPEPRDGGRRTSAIFVRN